VNGNTENNQVVK